MRNRATQREAIFYRLYKRLKEAAPGVLASHTYIPVHEFMGEIWIEEIGKWGFVSHECSARCSELYKTNPELIQRITIRGKSGASYYGYRLNPRPHVDMIKDPDLLTFYRKISRNRAPTSVERSRVEAEKAWSAI